MEKLTFLKTQYADGTTAIQAVTADGEPWATMSINLGGYGMFPQSENHIFVPTYKLDSDTFEAFKSALVKKVVNDNVPIGYASGMEVELVDNWKEICEDF